MKRVYSDADFLIVGHLQTLLERNHIACVVRNGPLQGGVGEIPPHEAWPELWVVEDFQLERARALVEAYVADARDSGPAWTCERCGEDLEGQFTECWQCGASRPAG